MIGAIRSGDGWRMTLPENGEPVVSIWARTPEDAEYMAHSENMEHMRAMEDERIRSEREQARLAADFARQQAAAHLKIRAKA